MENKNEEIAKDILRNWKETGLGFNTNLMETDVEVFEKEEKILGFFKHKAEDYKLTDEVINQIIDIDTVNKFKNKLVNFYKYHSREDHDLLFLSYKVKIEEEKLKTADILIDTCSSLITLYKGKLDTPELDKDLHKVATFFKEQVHADVMGDYGIEFTTVITYLPTLTNDSYAWFTNFNEKYKPYTQGFGDEGMGMKK